jgi:hypothetical protein
VDQQETKGLVSLQEATYMMDAGTLRGLRRIEHLVVMLNAAEIGKQLAKLPANGFATVCRYFGISESHARLLVDVSARFAALRDQGLSELATGEAMVGDKPLLLQLLAGNAAVAEEAL